MKAEVIANNRKRLVASANCLSRTRQPSGEAWPVNLGLPNFVLWCDVANATSKLKMPGRLINWVIDRICGSGLSADILFHILPYSRIINLKVVIVS
jgi:hypothetical protein